MVILLALSISSSCITNFMTFAETNAMPASVPAECTFGSSARQGESHRVTTNTLAAVAALFDAYYERVYFKSAGGTNDLVWNESVYGPRGFHEMTFASNVEDCVFNYGGGDRTLPATRRLVEWPNILEFKANTKRTLPDLIASKGQLIKRDTWNKTDSSTSYRPFSYWSSSLLGGTRLPAAFEWRTSHPTVSELKACPALFACEADVFMDDAATRNDVKNYVLPRLYTMADTDYYNWNIRDNVASNDLMITKSVSNIVDEAFGGNSGFGIQCGSRRLLADEYYGPGSNTLSSLPATACRALSILDRTYEFPILDDSQHILESDIEATAELVIDYYKDFSISEISFDESGSIAGTFTCDPFSAADLVFRSELLLQTETTNAAVASAHADRAEFYGTSTEVGTEFTMEAGSGSGICNFSYPPAGYGAGTNQVTVLTHGVAGSGLVIAMFIDTAGNLVTQTEGSSLITGGRLNVQVNLRRSARSVFTRPINSATIKRVFPVPVPCASAFQTGRVGEADASILCLAAKVSYRGVLSAKTFETCMLNYDLGDVGAFWTAYAAARNLSRAKMMTLMNAHASGNFQNPMALCNVGRSSIQFSSPSGFTIEGGTIRAVASFGQGENGLYAVTEYDATGMLIVTKVGYCDESGEWCWRNAGDPFSITYKLTIPNLEDNLKAETTAEDLNQYAVIVTALPLVTTDWNWKALKKGN